ncbi:MAG TPA: shikimate kinase [Bacteroidaceae bacterium]|nr:shikimate kinase [Bacteroidaceae bacterium]
MIRVFLMGFMGAGKTTLGKALAIDMGIDFHDLDQYIERRYMMSISSIFAKQGEEEFRRIESRLLREVGELEDVIIACGGSTPLIGDNMDYMLSQGKTVYLRCSQDTLFRRLKAARAKRPLIAEMDDIRLVDYIAAETARREPCYMKAEFICPGDRLESRGQISETVAYIEKLMNLK